MMLRVFISQKCINIMMLQVFISQTVMMVVAVSGLLINEIQMTKLIMCSEVVIISRYHISASCISLVN